MFEEVYKKRSVIKNTQKITGIKKLIFKETFNCQKSVFKETFNFSKSSVSKRRSTSFYSKKRSLSF